MNLHNFSFTHCEKLSTACEKHFKRDLCFYECSPNIGPWVVTVKFVNLCKELRTNGFF